MARLDKRSRKARSDRAYHLRGDATIDTNLKRTDFEFSDIKITNLRSKGAEKFQYPYAKLGSEAKRSNSKVYVPPETGMVGYRLTKRKHRKVLAKVEWKGAFAR